jgi:N-acetylmuramoyl-L-alanine amidase
MMADSAEQLAAVILSHNFKSISEIQADYHASAGTDSGSSQSNVRILLVPGHEPDYGGAEYEALKERDMNVELAQDLQQFLDSNPHYQVFVTRDTQAWSPEFATYFQNDWNDIVQWATDSKSQFSNMVAIGSTSQATSTVYHINAAPDVALRLYGITKWADENNIDIAINIHFNDNVRADANKPGAYSGFAIYVPAAQYGNSTTTKAIAESVFNRLAKYNPVSDLPGESIGIVDDPELIALGANDTADAASMLIEYSYIYEPQLQDPQLRSVVIKDLAYQTYLGLQDFFDPSTNMNLAGAYDTLLLPHIWNSSLTNANPPPTEIFALQMALAYDGDFPPNGQSKNDCPRTGILDACTRAALELFQNKNSIGGENGVIGDTTLKVLNGLY